MKRATKLLSLTGATVAVATIAAHAQDRANTPDAELGRFDTPMFTLLDGDNSVWYYAEQPAHENFLLKLECSGLQLWLGQRMLADLLLSSGADDPFDYPQVRIQADGVLSPPFSLTELTNDDMAGGWRALFIGAFRVGGFSRADWEPVGGADNIAVVTPAFEIPLTPAVGDPENRAAFVEACLAL